MLVRCNGGENLHRNTLEILEMLGCYRWDAKMVVALASFMQSYGLFWLILQLKSGNGLASHLAIVKQIPSTITSLKPMFKALNLLVGTVLRLTRLLISYESLSVKHELVDDEDREITRSKIYLASYWTCRSLLVCSSQFADLRALSLEQVHVLSIPPLIYCLISSNLLVFRVFQFSHTRKLFLSLQVFGQNRGCSMGAIQFRQQVEQFMH